VSTVMLGGSLLDRPGMDDRSVGASDVLAALST
jgi:4-hydroxy-3-methylbut-2-enyl diphosphate reductase